MSETCRECGANLALVGRRHNCRPRTRVVAESVTTQPVTTPSVTTEAVASVTTQESKDLPRVGSGDKARVYRWRDANRDRYNAYMRKWRRDRAAEEVDA
jgi:hypothetical protein